MDTMVYTATAGAMGVLTVAVEVPEAVYDAAGKLFFGKSGDEFVCHVAEGGEMGDHWSDNPDT